MTESVKLLPELKKRLLSLKQKQQPNFSLGERGETIALAYLQHQGYREVARNILSYHVEVDLVMIDPSGVLVFVEVKTRSSGFAGNPSAAVSFHKLQLMKTAGKRLVEQLDWNHDYRFDIISILPGRIEHYENVTWLR